MNEEQELPHSWVWTKLGDVLTRITNGYALPQFNEAFELSLPITRIETISNGTIDLEKVKYVEAPAEEKVEQYKLRRGDILFSHINSDNHLGKTAYFDISDLTLLHGINLLLMRFTDAVTSKYAHYLFNHYRAAGEFIKIAQRAVNQSSINQKKLSQLAFPLPPLPEQRRIVAKLEELFSKLDAGVAAVRRTQALLKRYRQSVLHAAVTGELTRAWREAHPLAPAETGAALLQRIRTERRAQWEAAQVAKRGGQMTLNDAWKSKYVEPEAVDASKLLELPAGWTWASMRQLGEVRLGRQRAPQHHAGPHMRPYLRVANVYEDRFDLRDVMEMNFTPEEYETYALRENDILLNEGQSLELVGRPALYRNEVPGACFTNTLVRFRVYQNVLPVYALSVFRSYLHNGEFQKIASWTTSIAHLGADRFAGLHFPLPPLPEQAEIVAEVERRLTVLDALSQTLTHELKRAERLRQSLLHRAFTGRLVPQDATDEPAAALLARLRAGAAAAGPAKAAKGGRKAKPEPKSKQLSIKL